MSSLSLQHMHVCCLNFHVKCFRQNGSSLGLFVFVPFIHLQKHAHDITILAAQFLHMSGPQSRPTCVRHPPRVGLPTVGVKDSEGGGDRFLHRADVDQDGDQAVETACGVKNSGWVSIKACCVGISGGVHLGSELRTSKKADSSTLGQVQY